MCRVVNLREGRWAGFCAFVCVCVGTGSIKMSNRKLSRDASQRKALLRNLTTSFFLAERIETTEARAKEIQRSAERMITLAKKGGLHARRQALSFILDEDAVKKLFDIIGPRFEDRAGGYTRLVKKGYRQGDGAPMVVLELV